MTIVSWDEGIFCHRIYFHLENKKLGDQVTIHFNGNGSSIGRQVDILYCMKHGADLPGLRCSAHDSTETAKRCPFLTFSVERCPFSTLFDYSGHCSTLLDFV